MIQLEQRDGIAIVRMEAPKANSMNVPFLEALERAFGEAGESGARAVVLTGKGRTFSAGLALPELIELDRAAMRAFMERFDQAMLRVLECPLPVVAAVNGFAIAGGCVLALMCEARVMAAGEATIGLNEVRIGLGLPALVVEGLRLRVPPAAVTELALGGGLYPAEAARALGLVDEVAAPEALEARAIARANLLGAEAAPARTQVKAVLVRPTVEAIRARRAAEGERWLDTWFSEAAQAALRDALSRIRR